MNILLTGAGGQVGWELARKAPLRGLRVEARTRQQLDISDPVAVGDAIKENRPALVINAAAYTKVDQAEEDFHGAFRVNATGPGLLAAACAEAGAALIHLSTDYVFDGTGTSAYQEDAPLAPLGVYGKSKAAGEAAVRRALARHLIVRTAWVYGVHGANFVKTMLRIGKERECIRVVADQSGCPTSAADIAEALIEITMQIHRRQEVPWGTYHFCGDGITTWHGFAETIFTLARTFGYPAAPRIAAITTAEYPTPVRRPAFSALDCGRIAKAFDIQPRPWQTGLAETLGELLHPPGDPVTTATGS